MSETRIECVHINYKCVRIVYGLLFLKMYILNTKAPHEDYEFIMWDSVKRALSKWKKKNDCTYKFEGFGMHG